MKLNNVTLLIICLSFTLVNFLFLVVGAVLLNSLFILYLMLAVTLAVLLISLFAYILATPSIMNLILLVYEQESQNNQSNVVYFDNNVDSSTQVANQDETQNITLNDMIENDTPSFLSFAQDMVVSA